MKFLLLALALLLAAAACSARRGALVGKPVAVDTSKEIRGRKLFQKNCDRCHPGGAAGLGPALNNKPLPRPLLRYQIRNGVGAMPGFDERHISADELEAIVEYVVTLRTQN